MICIKANKELFEAWDYLGKRISALKSVAQNDMEIEDFQFFEEWNDMVDDLSLEFTKLWACTLEGFLDG